MSESSKRKPGSSVVDPRKGKGETPLRLVTPENSVDFSPPTEPTDDSPTIISKTRPKASTDAPYASPPTESLMSDLRGRKLAHFELLEAIGVGGMAAVLRARDSQLDRIIALKILPPEMAQDPENVRRFHQEARAAAKLDHENIARVFFCGEDQNLHFIAFEHVEGDNLRTILERRGRLPIDEAIGYVLQIAAGLEHAHGRGVIHRDVKPSNIIITPSGRAKLVDMGLARNLEKVDDQQLTQSGVTLGTFDYISPEQALEPRDADGRSDMYSLGCTVYHMVTGQPPTPEGTAAKKLHHHQHVAPIDPRLLNPEVTDEVALILGKMMAKDPRDRYQRPVELVQHLMHVAQKLGVGGAVPEGGFLVEAPLPSEPRLSTPWMIGIGMAALAAVMLVLSLAPPTPTPKPLPPSIPQKNTQPPIAAIVPQVTPAANVPNSEFATQLQTRNAYTAPGLVKLGDGIVVRGDGKRTIDIASPDQIEKLTLRYEHVSKNQADTANTGEVAAGLLFEDCDVTFRNLQIEIQSSTQHYPVAAIAMRGRGTLRFEKCIFVPKVIDRSLIPRDSAKTPLVPVAAVLAESGGDGTLRPKLIFDQCAFLHGQVAVASQGVADVVMTDCTFRPHHAFVHLRGPGESTVRMENCSGFVLNGPAFRLDGESACKLTLTNNIFSRPETALGSESSKDQDQPDLIRQIDSSTPHVVLESSRNLFHNLNALWVMRTASNASDRLIVGLEEFRREVQQAKGNDLGSVATNISPWLAKDPLKKDPLKDEKTNDAFKLQSRFPELRPSESKIALGVRMGPWPRGELPLRRLDDPAPDYVAQLESRQRVVAPDDPSVDGKVFKSIADAVRAATGGEEILLKPGKAGTEFKLNTVKTEKLQFTLKPWKDTKPVLSMSPSLYKDAAMFWVSDGSSLNFDGLEFRLEPDLDGYTGFAVTQFQGNGAANFSNCVFTLRHGKEKGSNVPLAVVTLAEPEKAMMMNVPPASTTPSVSFTNCFLRGDGDAVVARQSTPLKLKVDRSLAMLSGSLLSIQSVGKDSAGSEPIKIECSRSAFFHGDALIVAKGDRTAKGFHPIRGRAFDETDVPGIGISDCWFVPLSPETPLVRLETSESLDDSTLRGMFTWIANRNVYGSYDRMLDQKSEGDLFRYRMTPMQWKEMFHRGAAVVLANAFQPPSLRRLSTATPDMARLHGEAMEENGVSGPNLDELPHPAAAPEKTDE